MMSGKKITSASLHKRAQSTHLAYIRDVQPHQSMPLVTNRCVRGVRARLGTLCRPSVDARPVRIAPGAVREQATIQMRLVT